MNPHSNSPAIELRRVSKAYDGRPALNDVSLTVSRGETLALVGPSGAGKTTMLRLIAGMIDQDAGEVLLHGHPVAALRSRSVRADLVGMVQQRLDLVPQLSVLHNVQAGMLGSWSLARSLLALVSPNTSPEVRATLGQVGLGDKSNVRVDRLSGGEQQRVALGRLLVQNPQIILADEPVASLDPTLAEEMIQLLSDLARREGKTLLVSLHTPELARDYFDRIVGLREGTIAFDMPMNELESGTLAKLYEREVPPPSRTPVSGAPAPL